MVSTQGKNDNENSILQWCGIDKARESKCFLTLSTYFTDEEGSFLKLAVAIMVIFDSSNIGTRSSLV